VTASRNLSASPSLSGRIALAAPLVILLSIALLRGSAYANLLPPWGIIDEEQHVHYIQHWVEQGSVPIVGDTYLSDEIIQSVVQTGRWVTFKLAIKDTDDPKKMGLEGHSYEGYQPPLYYLVLSPLLRIPQGTILEKLYLLRWGTVILSLLSLIGVYLMALRITPSRPVAFLIGLIYALIPERSMAVSRVNNDALLELFAVYFLLVCIQVVKEGLDDRRALALGVLYGLGVLSKMSMLPLGIALLVIWITQRNQVRLLRSISLTITPAVILILPWMLRNLRLYGDPTGFAAVQPLLSFSPPTVTSLELLRSFPILFERFWVVWWDGAAAASNLHVMSITLLMFIFTCFSLTGWVQWKQYVEDLKVSKAITIIFIMSATVLAIYSSLVLASYWRGQVPVLQGRLLLPAASVIIVLYGAGLSQFRYGRYTLFLAIAALMWIDAHYFVNNLLLQYYPSVSTPSLRLSATLSGMSAALSQVLNPFAVVVRASWIGYLLAHGLALLSSMMALSRVVPPPGEATPVRMDLSQGPRPEVRGGR
jgi:hypothetical protein